MVFTRNESSKFGFPLKNVGANAAFKEICEWDAPILISAQIQYIKSPYMSSFLLTQGWRALAASTGAGLSFDIQTWPMKTDLLAIYQAKCLFSRSISQS